MDYLINYFGSIIKRERNKKKFTQKELGKLMGKDARYIYFVEKFMMPKFDEGCRLCILLDLNPVDVYNEMIKKLKEK